MEIEIEKIKGDIVEFSCAYGIGHGQWINKTTLIIGKKYYVEFEIPNIENLYLSSNENPEIKINFDGSVSLNMKLSSIEEDLVAFNLNDNFIEVILEDPKELKEGYYYSFKTSGLEIYDYNL